jgi:hypothetical protein
LVVVPVTVVRIVNVEGTVVVPRVFVLECVVTVVAYVRVMVVDAVALWITQVT